MNTECRRKLKYRIREALVISMSKWRLNKKWLSLQDCYILQCCYVVHLLFFLRFLSQAVVLRVGKFAALPQPTPLLPAFPREKLEQQPRAATGRMLVFHSVPAWPLKIQPASDGKQVKEKSIWAKAQVFMAAQPSRGTRGGDQTWKGYQDKWCPQLERHADADPEGAEYKQPRCPPHHGGRRSDLPSSTDSPS